jgi:hypothetical protein
MLTVEIKGKTFLLPKTAQFFNSVAESFGWVKRGRFSNVPGFILERIKIPSQIIFGFRDLNSSPS